MTSTALVTGAGSGIGRRIAWRLSGDGYAVAVVDIDANGAAETVEQVADRGGTARAYVRDITAPDVFIGLLDHIEAELGPVDVLCNNAGVGVAAALADTDAADWDRILALNLTAVFHGCRAALPRMVARGHGVIVNTSSVAGVVGVRERAAYCASKAGVIGLTRAIAADYAGRGIRANAICPGTVETEWIGKILADADNPEAARASMAARQLDGRMGTPEEVADGVGFLVGAGGRFMNGSALVMDGGMSAV